MNHIAGASLSCPQNFFNEKASILHATKSSAAELSQIARTASARRPPTRARFASHCDRLRQRRSCIDSSAGRISHEPRLEEGFRVRYHLEKVRPPNFPTA